MFLEKCYTIFEKLLEGEDNMVEWIKKYWKRGVVVAIAMWFCSYVIYWLLITPSPIGIVKPEDTGDMMSYLGALLGGALTLGGVWWTINDQNNKREDDMRKQDKLREKQRKETQSQKKRDLSIQYAPIVSPTFNEITKCEFYLEKDEYNDFLLFVRMFLELQNLGRGEAYQLQADSVILETHIRPISTAVGGNLEYKRREIGIIQQNTRATLNIFGHIKININDYVERGSDFELSKVKLDKYMHMPIYFIITISYFDLHETKCSTKFVIHYFFEKSRLTSSGSVRMNIDSERSKVMQYVNPSIATGAKARKDENDFINSYLKFL